MFDKETIETAMNRLALDKDVLFAPADGKTGLERAEEFFKQLRGWRNPLQGEEAIYYNVDWKGENHFIQLLEVAQGTCRARRMPEYGEHM